MTEEEIKAIETRCNAAMQQLSAFGGWRNEFEKFARPVVAQDIPALIAECRRLRGALASADAAFRAMEMAEKAPKHLRLGP